MCTRGQWQLQKLIVHYCRGAGDSAGARTYIKDQLPSFASANPSMQVEVLSRYGKAPTLTALYADGTRKTVDVKRKGPEEISLAVGRLRDSATATMRSLAKPVLSKRPSVQGVWGPDVDFGAHFSIREGKTVAAAAATAGSTATR